MSQGCGKNGSLAPPKLPLSPPRFKFGTQKQQDRVDILNLVLNFAVVRLVRTEI